MNPYLFDRVYGPSDTAKFFAAKKDHVSVSPGPTRWHAKSKTHLRNAPKTIFRDPTKSQLFPQFPFVHFADCEAWKICDRHYTTYAYRFRKQWKPVIKVPGISTYDAWMKIAVPHILRGIEKSQCPIKAPGGRVTKFESCAWLNALAHYPLRTCEPNYKCQTHGLYLVRLIGAEARWAGEVLDPFGAPCGWTDVHLGYEYRLDIESYYHNCDHPRQGRFTLSGFDKWLWHDNEWDIEDQPTNQAGGHILRTTKIVPWWRLVYTPPKITTTGEFMFAWDNDRQIDMFWLKAGSTWAYWPQIPGHRYGWTKYGFNKWSDAPPERNSWPIMPPFPGGRTYWKSLEDGACYPEVIKPAHIDWHDVYPPDDPPPDPRW